MSILDTLLRPEMPDVRKNVPTKDYEIKRLSKAAGEKVVFKLSAIPYNTIEEMRSMEDMQIEIVLAGVVEPDLRNQKLMEKYGGHTPVDTVKSLLLPGEIAELQIAIEQLCGYRQQMISEVRKNSKTEPTRS